MGTLYENIAKLCDEKGIKGGKMCTDLGISKGLLTDLKMGRRSGISAKTADKIASYFGVSVGYLLGTETGKTPASEDKRQISDHDIKFALFNGDDEITDEMFDEVKNFAAYVRQRENEKRKKNNI